MARQSAIVVCVYMCVYAYIFIYMYIYIYIVLNIVLGKMNISRKEKRRGGSWRDLNS